MSLLQIATCASLSCKRIQRDPSVIVQVHHIENCQLSDRVHVGCVNPDTVHVVFHSARPALVPSQLPQGCCVTYFVAPRKCTNSARGSRIQRWLATLRHLTPFVSMSERPSCWHTVTVNVTGPKPLVRLCPDMRERLRNPPFSFRKKLVAALVAEEQVAVQVHWMLWCQVITS